MTTPRPIRSPFDPLASWLEQTIAEKVERALTVQHGKTPEKRLLRIEEAAAILSVSRSTLERMIAAGTFPVRMVGSERRIATRDLDEWVASQPRLGGQGETATATG